MELSPREVWRVRDKRSLLDSAQRGAVDPALGPLGSLLDEEAG